MARTGRSRKGVGGPKTPEGRARALANLRQNKRHLDRGVGIMEILPGQNATKALVQQIVDVMEGDGFSHIRPADKVSVQLLATLLRRIGQAERYLDENGLVKPNGEVRPAAEYIVRAVREARALADALGLSPAGRARLGLDVARGSSIIEFIRERYGEDVTDDQES